jgi:two-component system phosphate regulon sensor histidine kinase PhoR
MRTRLFYKLLGAYVAIAVLAVVIAAFVIESRIKSDLTNWVKDDLLAQARIIAIMPQVEIAGQYKQLAERTHARITLIDARGKVIVDSDHHLIAVDNHLHRSEIQEARLKGQGITVRYSQTLKADTLNVAMPLYSGTHLTGYIRLSRPMLQVVKTVDEIRLSILMALILILFISVILALVFSARMVGPIQEIASFTDKVRKGDISGMVMIDSRDEIGQMAKNINEMVAELQTRIRQANDEKWKLRAAFASMNEGVMVLDAQNRIENLNRGMTRIIGREYADIVGKIPLEVFRNVELQDALNRFRHFGEAVLREITLGDDQPVVLNVSISAIKSLPGEEPKVMIVFHDVTRLKKLERMRADFVANVTHEIKTPLTAIIGFVETIEQGAIENTPDTRKFLQTIRENAGRLDRLVDDLLTLSNIELGETKLDFRELVIADVLEKARALIQTKADLKGITIREELPAALPPIRADQDKAVQALLNILDNAVKFTPDGGRIDVTASEEQKDFITIKVMDTGPGIPRSDLPRLGERFYRVDRTRSRDLGGTGLGLSIVKHLMKAHGGEIRIDSIPGQGTTVSLKFPVFLQPSHLETHHE